MRPYLDSKTAGIQPLRDIRRLISRKPLEI